ncbi:MAG: hypothetical protein O3A00_19320 [Planctomycetota bacterium]|nr:hypothetical protein [Planctomycetota bacterium]
MRVKLRCPNKECGKVLVLEVQKPGVGVRCKSCGTAFRVPKGAGGASAAKAAEPDDEIEEYEEDVEPERAPRSKGSASRRPSKPAARRPAPSHQDDDDFDDYDDFEDEFEDEEDDYDVRPTRSRGRSGGGTGGWKRFKIGVTIVSIAFMVLAGTHGLDLLISMIGQLMSGPSAPPTISASDLQGLDMRQRFEKQREMQREWFESRQSTISFLQTLGTFQKVRVLIACLAFIPLIVGAVFMMMAPDGTTKGLSIAALSCFSIALIFWFIHVLRVFGSGMSGFPEVGLSVVYARYGGDVGKGLLTLLIAAVVEAGFILAMFAMSIAANRKKIRSAAKFCSVAAYVGIGHFGFLILSAILGMAASPSKGWYYTLNTFDWIAGVFFSVVIALYIKSSIDAKKAV